MKNQILLRMLLLVVLLVAVVGSVHQPDAASAETTPRKVVASGTPASTIVEGIRYGVSAADMALETGAVLIPGFKGSLAYAVPKGVFFVVNKGAEVALAFM